MKKSSLESHIQAAVPKDTQQDSHLTDAIMQKITSLQPATSHKWSFFTGWPQLSKLAMAMIIVVALTLLGGTTYALYKVLWQRPHVTTSSTSMNQFGRKQVTASLKNCQDQSAEVTFEIRNGSTLDPAEISKVLQARCELDAISDWVGENKPSTQATRPTQEGVSYSSSTMLYPEALRVVSINDKNVTLASNSETKKVALASNVTYIANNTETTKDSIQPGDGVLYVQKIALKQTTTKTQQGELTTESTPTSHTVTHLIKTDLPIAYYSVDKQNQIAQRTDCIGNQQDSCLDSQRVDIYDGTPSSSLQQKTVHTIQGTLVDYTSDAITLKSSSGRTFTITTPATMIDTFNQQRSQDYDGLRIKSGDLLQVTYRVSGHDSSRMIDKDSIIRIELMLSMLRKTNPIEKY